MLRFPKSSPVVPFIANQRIWWLDAPFELAKECLRPEAFAAAREVRKGDTDHFATHNMPEGCQWREVYRPAFLACTNNRLLCLTIDAGIGKTTAMLQTQFIRGCLLDGHLVIGIQFDHLPTDANDYLSEDNKNKKSLANYLSKYMGIAPWTIVNSLLKSKIRTGQFTLVVDAMDQVTLNEFSTNEDSPEQKARELATFLNDHSPSARCVISGRPQAISRHWEDLFERCEPWRFAQIDQFTPTQRQKYLGKGRSKLLDRLDADVVAIPRMLEVMHRLPKDQLRSIRTSGELYMRVFKQALESDSNKQLALMKPHTAMFLFSMLAFDTLARGYLNGIHDQRKTEEFLNEVFEGRKTQIDFHYQRKGNIDFDNELLKLGKLNTFIHHSVFDSSETLDQIVFRDQTVRDFMAAVWISKYADLNDLKWVAENKYKESEKEKKIDPDDIPF